MAFTGIVLAFLLVFGGLGYFSYRQAKKRREMLAGFARSEGWTWVARDDRWASSFMGDPFGQGQNRKAQNVLTGVFRTRSMAAFDYSYETSSTDSEGKSTTTTHRYAVCSLALPAATPVLELVPEGRLGRVGTMLGMQDIELESEDFNRRYRVRCSDPKLAYDVLPARTMEALLSRPALHLRLSGGEALCWESGAHSPTQLLARLDSLSTLIDGVPPFVWSDLKGSTS